MGTGKDVDRVLRSELIGNRIKVVDAENKSLIGIEGKIILETKNTLTVMDENNNRKKLIKKQVVFNMKKDGKTYQVYGKVLVGRPEERLKKVRRLK